MPGIPKNKEERLAKIDARIKDIEEGPAPHLHKRRLEILRAVRAKVANSREEDHAV